MNKIKLLVPFMGLFFLFSYSMSRTDNEDIISLPDIDISGSPNSIVPLPVVVPSIFTDVFVKYTKIVAPNGRPVQLLAQADWTDDKLVKVRNILEHMLTDYPGSTYGSDNLIDVEYLQFKNKRIKL